MEIITYEALVVGTGAAGYSAACRLRQLGVEQVAVVTEGVYMGTSRNTGSDKQTYYKLSLSGDCADSVRQMAENLFAGGAVDGDTALCEAALSSRCFLQLCELGVPFPVNRYGEYVGYKTDHDPFARATSAGPLTSKFMTEALEAEAKRLQIPVYDGLYAVEVLQDADGVCGLLCLHKECGDYVIFRAAQVILATGGPAGIYENSVYPKCHTGSSSLALRAGAQFQNLTEWQYGLASTEPRWNVSGTYMQVLPRFVSVDDAGTEREFLLDYFRDPYEALSMVFLKGYQWPFDSSKVMEGSSVIDLLVYCQTRMGRQVYLDFRQNPLDAIDYEKLSPEAYQYLKKAEACFGKPIDRLLKMNRPAYELYRGKGVDLTKEMLPIALCAQHCNGGIAVDLWWQTTVPGLFAIGECAGTHGIARPGGSALNAGQVGALRCAQYISRRGRELCAMESFQRLAETALNRHKTLAGQVLNRQPTVEVLQQQARCRMSRLGGPIREETALQDALAQAELALKDLPEAAGVEKAGQLHEVYQYADSLICQQAVLSAMLDYARQVGVTRGSALYIQPNGKTRPGLDFRFVSAPRACAGEIQQGFWTQSGCRITWRAVRPLPEAQDVFETVWRDYREYQNVY